MEGEDEVWAIPDAPVRPVLEGVGRERMGFLMRGVGR